MQLTLHVTKACNLRCRYCYYDDFPAGKMTVQTALDCTDQVLDLGHDHLGVTFFGGEPLLAKDLIREIVPRMQARCAERSVSVNFKIPTNGALLDEEFLSFCETHGVLISLSIDGNSEAQADRIRPDGSSSFSATLAALRLLAKDATTFATYSVITPRNAGMLSDSIEFLYEEGSRIMITALDYGAPWTRKDLEILKREYEKVAKFYISETQLRSHFYLSAFDSKILAHTRPDTEGDTVCRIGVNQLSVLPDGTYYPCIQFVEKPEFAVGNVRGGIDLEACSRLFRCSASASPECMDCGIAERCSHHCACVSWQTTGTLDGVAPISCEHERILMPIADRVAKTLFKRQSPLFINKHYNPEYNLLRAIEDVVSHNAPDHETTENSVR